MHSRQSSPTRATAGENSRSASPTDHPIDDAPASATHLASTPLDARAPRTDRTSRSLSRSVTAAPRPQPPQAGQSENLAHATPMNAAGAAKGKRKVDDAGFDVAERSESARQKASRPDALPRETATNSAKGKQKVGQESIGSDGAGALREPAELKSLPNELLLQILNSLQLEAQLRMARSSKKFNLLAGERFDRTQFDAVLQQTRALGQSSTSGRTFLAPREAAFKEVLGSKDGETGTIRGLPMVLRPKAIRNLDMRLGGHSKKFRETVGKTISAAVDELEPAQQTDLTILRQTPLHGSQNQLVIDGYDARLLNLDGPQWGRNDLGLSRERTLRNLGDLALHLVLHQPMGLTDLAQFEHAEHETIDAVVNHFFAYAPGRRGNPVTLRETIDDLAQRGWQAKKEKPDAPDPA